MSPDCCTVGAEAKKVFEEAQQMIHTICSDRCVQAHGVIGLFPAFSDGDDIKLLNEEKTDVITTLFGLRQQVLYTCTILD